MRPFLLITITFGILAFSARSNAQSPSSFTQAQADKLSAGFAQACSSEIAGAMGRIGLNGMPKASEMRNLNDYVGSSRDQVQRNNNHIIKGLQMPDGVDEHWGPILRYMFCKNSYALAHWNDSPTASQGNPKVRPSITANANARNAPDTRLPRARPAKMAAWSPNAMPTSVTEQLSPRYAAERADLIASCPVPVRQLAQKNSISIAEANLIVEGAALSDPSMGNDAGFLKNHLSKLQQKQAAGEVSTVSMNIASCVYGRRIAQLEGSPLSAGAVGGTLTPLSIGGQTPSRTQQGKDVRIIASDGKSAMHCVRLDQLSSGNSGVSGGGRRLFNGCTEEVEITWCNTPGCGTPTGGNTWTVQPGRGWPVSADGEVRWAACLGRDTAAFVKGSHGLRYYCSAPAKK